MNRDHQSGLWLPRSRDEALYRPEPRLDGLGRCRFGLGLGLGLGMGGGGIPAWLRLARQLSSQIEAAVMSGGTEVGAAGLYMMVPGYITYVIDTGHPSYPTTLYVQTWVDVLQPGVIPGVGWTGHVLRNLEQTTDALEAFITTLPNGSQALQMPANANNGYLVSTAFPSSGKLNIYAALNGSSTNLSQVFCDAGMFPSYRNATDAYSGWYNGAYQNLIACATGVQTLGFEVISNGIGTLYRDSDIATRNCWTTATSVSRLLCRNGVNYPVVSPVAAMLVHTVTASADIRNTFRQLSQALYGAP